MSTKGSWSSSLITALGDNPSLVDSQTDAMYNGTAVGFARLLNPKVMDRPVGYSEKMMKQIASRYAHNAQELNVHRSAR
ncbi:LTA synthase family protein, partial [Alloscardovia omnicolens]|nr:LTA synthase family protein [Alloscardovia omnicolens]